MKLSKRIGKALAATIVVAAALQLVAPKAVRAVVSTFVTVANTPTNPVPVGNAQNSSGFLQPLLTQDYDNLAHRPFAITQSCRFDITGLCLNVGISAFEHTASVIEEVSGFCSYNGANGTAQVTDIHLVTGASPGGGPGEVQVYFWPTWTIPNPVTGRMYFGRQTHFVVNAASGAAQMSVSLNTSTQSAGSCVYTYVGYVVDVL
jgi:hypothetical protein